LKAFKNEAFIEYNMKDFSIRGDFLIEFYNNSLMKKVKILWKNNNKMEIFYRRKCSKLGLILLFSIKMA